jgi:hypothetical protein
MVVKIMVEEVKKEKIVLNAITIREMDALFGKEKNHVIHRDIHGTIAGKALQ